MAQNHPHKNAKSHYFFCVGFLVVVCGNGLAQRRDEAMLDINENSVSAVLLNDGWHQPVAGTFKIGNIRIHADAAAGVDFGNSSATWDEHSRATVNVMVTVSAPLTSILAIQQKK